MFRGALPRALQDWGTSLAGGSGRGRIRDLPRVVANAFAAFTAYADGTTFTAVALIPRVPVEKPPRIFGRCNVDRIQHRYTFACHEVPQQALVEAQWVSIVDRIGLLQVRWTAS